MQRNPYGISSIGSLIIMVVLLSGVIGVSIPLMSGGLPRRQGDAQNSPTPAHSEMFANQAGTPAVLAEAAGRSDGTVGQSSKSTPVVSTAAPQCSFDTHGHIAGPGAAAENAGAFCGFPRFCRYAAGRDTIPTPSVVQPTPTASSTTAVVQPSATAVPTNTSSPVATATSVPAARAASRVQAHSEPTTTTIADRSTPAHEAHAG